MCNNEAMAAYSETFIHVLLRNVDAALKKLPHRNIYFVAYYLN